MVLQWIEQSEKTRLRLFVLQSLWTAIEMDKATELNEAYVRSIMHQVKAPRICRNWYGAIPQRSHRVQQLFCCLFLYPNSTHSQQDYEALCAQNPIVRM